QDAKFVAAFKDMLSDPQVAASKEVLKAVETESEKAAKDLDLAKRRCQADRWNEQLTDWAEGHLTLLGKSADLRGRLYHALTSRVQSLSQERKVSYFYDLVEDDYVF